MKWSDGLENGGEQYVAASHCGEHSLLLAGPGTGKTFVLTRHILYLIQERGVLPDTIRAVTFTRAAATELRDRVAKELDDNHLPHVSTLHSFALRTLLQQQAGSRLPQPLRVADDWEEKHIILEDLKLLLSLSGKDEAHDLIQTMSSDWDRGDEPRHPNPKFRAAWDEHRRAYGYTLRAELVYQLKQALLEGQVSIDDVGHLIVDEYQDLNPCDLWVLKHLVDNGAQLYAAGDDDQAIYGFRCADPDCVRNFTDQYKPSRELRLVECRRCGQAILDYALDVAKQSVKHKDKPLHAAPSNAPGETKLLHFADQYGEAREVARICRWLVHAQSVPLNEILILVRSDEYAKFTKPVREALEKKNLAAKRAVNPLEPLDVGQGRQLLAFLHLVADRHDSLAWRTLLQERKNNVGTLKLQKVQELTSNRGVNFATAIQAIRSDPQLRREHSSVADDVEAIETILQVASSHDAEDLRGLIHNLAQQVVTEDASRREVLAVLEQALKAADTTELRQFIQSLGVNLGDKEQERAEDAISLMTMHQAKGLTADAVFVIAAENEYIPGRAQGAKAEDDERHLLYVSMTRARKFLYITHCHRRRGQQGHSGSLPTSQQRTLTKFLSGGPVQSFLGTRYVPGL